MRTNEDIENFLYDLEFSFETLDEGLWRVNDEADDVENLVLYRTGTALNFRLKVFDLPKNNVEELLMKLLQLNASDMVHGAYAVEEQAVIITAALEIENLDRNELQATVEALGLALRSHYPVLSEFRN